MQPYVNVIGAGLAGSEAAFRIASTGIKVKLYEMRPRKMTPVHRTGDFAELVCSNSLKSEDETTAQGMLKKEMRLLGSLLLSCAEEARVPAGSALAVDRSLFSRLVTERLKKHPNIEVICEEITSLPDDAVTIVATGPLTSDGLALFLQRMTGKENLYFYDAVAPSVTLESLDLNKVFKASRYGKGTDDYLNCPLTEEEYDKFYYELVNADIKEGHAIDKSLFFSGCMPIEVMARRGKDTLRFGPMRPVGLKDPRTGENAYAVVQLRQEDKEGKVWGLVGFQTRLKWGEQDRIFRLIPGLENAEFVRYGVMHRNTYINSPSLLYPTLQYRKNSYLLFAGQITGVEGYMESAATGIIAGINAVRLIKGEKCWIPDKVTMIGALLDFITSSPGDNFQPINANFGLLPPLEKPIKDKNLRNRAYLERSLHELKKYSELFLG
ncbi:methylenetetrahydrofolate--tRNA-(uracil-5-)-methyltransferase [Thermosyntropha lipolytica DSM 11003]|uniref:Methylenetetrahydrofolate--tRNA-(uracil-5-)-methyltransferase TrmFO n=1 Tax=Thermosyntropha lipolytica DSM 11003 TaxID=1123382 RepID=A0A1M5L1A9_9FIRM|nr:methylenetetrahydrofolate--tRNA-(uracil(54)-C(5))-methyltransferase (FADH(2)-oxidizing) TrmFO [Thermosyntropha lipolytica]SHG58735.1 methylenetetrahydrofolate--tRNA-(uracil-5-)-methyltransferase [Thermosyntropha lipolytica DSM 11003]